MNPTAGIFGIKKHDLYRIIASRNILSYLIYHLGKDVLTLDSRNFNVICRYAEEEINVEWFLSNF